MALIDKIKAQAAVVAQKAQEAGKAGQSKIEDVQARRKADALLRQLGAAVYAQRTGKAGDDNAADIERLVGEISAFESENGPLDASTSAAPEPDAATETATETPPEGGFTL
jgi:hypothetical protein